MTELAEFLHKILNDRRRPAGARMHIGDDVRYSHCAGGLTDRLHAGSYE
jgi:hypothetical protein